MPDFGAGWFVRRPLDLLIHTREVIDWSLHQLVRRLCGRLDLGSTGISQQKAEALRRWSEQRISKMET
jgi:hypothetical protein